MDKPTQLTFLLDQLRQEISLPPEAREQVVAAMAKLLFQLLILEEEKEDQDDLGQ
jgi:hypothetical protein